MASKRRMKNRRTKSNYSGWSCLPKELLEMILTKLGLADHVRYSAVCEWWRCVAAENTPTEKPLGLVRSYNPRRLIARLLSPQLLEPFWTPLSVKAQFIGIFEEWLVIKQVCPGGQIFLLNPSSGGQTLVPLPPLTGHSDACKVVLSASPSSGNCMIVLCDSGYRLAFWRLGDTTTGWTFILTDGKLVSDMVFHNDRLYIMYRFWGMGVFDSGLNKNPTLIEPQNGVHHDCKLVSAFGKLLLIQTSEICPNYEVFVLDPKNWGCTLLESLGDDNILFFSSIGSMSLSAKDHKDLRSDHLYSNYPYPKGKELFAYSLSRKTLTWEGASIISPVFFTLFKHECYFSIISRRPG